MVATVEARHGRGAAGAGEPPELTIVAQQGKRPKAAQSQVKEGGSPGQTQAPGFFEQRRKLIPEAALQEIVESAESLSKQHVALPKLNFGGLNLEACRRALRDLDAQRQSQVHGLAASLPTGASAGPGGTGAPGMLPPLAGAQPYGSGLSGSGPLVGAAARAGQGQGLTVTSAAVAAAAGPGSGASKATTAGVSASKASATAKATAALVANANSAVAGLVKSALHVDVVKASVLRSYGTSLDRWFAVWGARSDSGSAATREADGDSPNRLHKLPGYMTASQSLTRRYASCAGLQLGNPSVPITRDQWCCGVSLAFVLHFAAHVAAHEHANSHLTTRQVVKRYLLPRYPMLAARYCDTLPDALVGRPQFLVSHRWDAQFADLVLQLAHYFQGQDPETILLYIDVFSDRQGHHPVDHPLQTGPPAALLGGAKRPPLQPVAEGEGEVGDTAEALQPSQEVVEEAARQRAATFAHLEDVITDVQQTLLILDRDALVLTRAWVLWELWTTLQTHRGLAGCVEVLGYGVQWSFVLQELVLRLHFDSADASDPLDVEYIRAHVATTPEGTSGASRAILQTVIKSAARQAKTAEKLLTTSHGSPTRFVGLRVQQAIMLRLEGKLDEAERNLWSVLDYLVRGLHGDPEDLGFVVGALVDVMVTLDIPEEFHRAAWLCLTTQERMERHLGADSVASLRLAGSHIWALLRAGQVQVADQLSLLTLHRQETLGRPVHELLDTLFARATVLRVLGHAEQAEYLLIRAVKLGEQRLGWGHPHCAVALKLLGEWCVEAKRYEDAAVWLVQARVAMSRVYSRDSVSWARATLQLAQCMSHLDDLEAAEKLLLGLLKSGSNSTGNDRQGKAGHGTQDEEEADGATSSEEQAAGPLTSRASGVVAAALSNHASAAARQHSDAGSETEPSPEPPAVSEPHGVLHPQEQQQVHVGLSEANLQRDLGGLMFEVLQHLLKVLVTSAQPGRLHGAGPIPRAPEEPGEARSDSDDEEAQHEGEGGVNSPRTLVHDEEPTSPSGAGRQEGQHGGEEEEDDDRIYVPRLDCQALIAAGLKQSRRGPPAARGAVTAIDEVHAAANSAQGSQGEPSAQQLGGDVVQSQEPTQLSVLVPDPSSQPWSATDGPSTKSLLKSPSMVLLRSRSMQLKQPDAAALLQQELQHVEGLEGLTSGAWSRVSASGGPQPAGTASRRQSEAGRSQRASDAGTMRASMDGAAGERLSCAGDGEPPRTMVDVFSESIIIMSRLLYLYDQEKEKAERAAAALKPPEGWWAGVPGMGPPKASSAVEPTPAAQPSASPTGADAAVGDPSRPAGLDKQASLYRRAMTDAGAALWPSVDATTGRMTQHGKSGGPSVGFGLTGTGLGDGGLGPHSIFSSQPHERKFKVRNRNLALALAPLTSSGAYGGMGVGAIARALLAAAGGGSGGLDGMCSEPELRMAYGSEGGRSGWGASPAALQANSSTSCIALPLTSNRRATEPLGSPSAVPPALGAEASSSSALMESLSPTSPLVLGPTPPPGFYKSSQPLPLPVEQRRTELLVLSNVLQRHAGMLRVRGDDVGSALASQLGLAIKHHMSGPGEPDAIASVASVIHLLVTRRRYSEAKQQLEYRLSMPAMTATSKTTLQLQVGKHMTDVAFAAAAAGDLEQLAQALELGAMTFKGHKQLLVLAAQKGQRDVVDALLQFEPTLVDRPDANTAMRPLAVAAALGYRGIVKDLLGARVKVDLEAVDAYGRTPLVHAVLGGRKSTALALLEAGASTDARFGADRITPLIAAAAAGHTKLVPLLVSHGADLETADLNGRTPIFHAVMAGHMGPAAALLKAGADAGALDKEGCAPIIYATRMEFLEMVALLAVHRASVDLNVTDAKGWTPLHLAAGHGRTAIVDLLLSQGASIRVQDSDGRTPLMLAAKNGHLSICTALLIHSASQDGGHPVSIGDPDGQTAIQLRVDQALARVGARVATTAEVAKAIKEIDRIATLAMASADETTCLKALELLRHTAGRLTLVRSYAMMLDKSGQNAADWAEISGHEQLRSQLHVFTKRTL